MLYTVMVAEEVQIPKSNQCEPVSTGKKRNLDRRARLVSFVATRFELLLSLGDWSSSVRGPKIPGSEMWTSGRG